MTTTTAGPMPGEQCVNKACGEDAVEVLCGDTFCATHAQIAVEALAHYTPPPLAERFEDLDPEEVAWLALREYDGDVDRAADDLRRLRGWFTVPKS